MYVIVDCGGFKQIMDVDKPNAIRNIQDHFPYASIEGDDFGNAKLYSGEEIAKLFGDSNGKDNAIKNSVMTANIKSVKRNI